MKKEMVNRMGMNGLVFKASWKFVHLVMISYLSFYQVLKPIPELSKITFMYTLYVIYDLSLHEERLSSYMELHVHTRDISK